MNDGYGPEPVVDTLSESGWRQVIVDVARIGFAKQ